MLRRPCAPTAAWLAERDLAPATRDHYAQLLRDHVHPRFGDAPVPEINAAAVRTWHADLAKHTGPTARAHAYALLRTILATAVADELILANPCRSAAAAPRGPRSGCGRPVSTNWLSSCVRLPSGIG